MKVRLIEIKLIENSLNKLMEANLNVKIAYKLSKLLKKIGQELQDLEENRIRLVKKYSNDAENDKEMKVADDKVDEFQKEFNVLLNVEVDVPFEPISIDDLGDDIKLTPIDIIRLGNIISCDEDDEEKVEPMSLDDNVEVAGSHI